MYLPAHFEQRDPAVLREAIRRFPLATLVVCSPDGPVANHVPLLWEPDPAPLGRLRGHVARPNPLAALAADGIDALAIFSGPDAYVSPRWYPTKTRTGKVVPTWDYVAVHAAGRLRTFDDRAALRAHVTALTALHEADGSPPWEPDDAPADYVATMLEGIVGIELTVTSLRGKWKASQNRTPEDRAGVVSALRAMADEVERGRD